MSFTRELAISNNYNFIKTSWCLLIFGKKTGFHFELEVAIIRTHSFFSKTPFAKPKKML